MSYQICFIAGSEAGKNYPLVPNQALSIGRSHSNNVCVKEPDVSGRHVILRPGNGTNISLEVLSSRVTKYNGANVSLGTILDLSVNDVVQMGEEVSFRLEALASDDEQQTIGDIGKTTISDNSATALNIQEGMTAATLAGSRQNAASTASTLAGSQQNASTTSFSKTLATQASTYGRTESGMAQAEDFEVSNETIAFQTRAASEEELENIKNAYQAKHNRKVMTIALPIFIFFCLAIFVYFFMKPRSEEFLSWPVDGNGEFLNEYTKVAPYLALVSPSIPGAVVNEDGGKVEIETRIGKLRDVPFFMYSSVTKNPKTLTMGHTEAFAQWMQELRNKEPLISFEGGQKMFFLCANNGAGVPVSYIVYTRRVENDDLFGCLYFLRNGENVHSIMAEVPLSERYRSSRFFSTYFKKLILYAGRVAIEHWEGTSLYRHESTAAQDLEDARRFMDREAPVYWGRIFYLTRSALIKATLAKDQSCLKEAKELLVKLRQNQTVWYNTQKLAYQYALQKQDRNSMNSIQAMCESVFSADFQNADCRYELIKRKDWK